MEENLLRLHPHIWKYFSPHYRLCRVCGEAQRQEQWTIYEEWETIIFQEFLDSYKRDIEFSKEKYDFNKKIHQKIESDNKQERRKGLLWLKS